MMPALIKELGRRRVFRVAGTYVFVAWLIVQVADALGSVLKLPEWAMSFVVYALVLGFPISLILAWAFDVGPQGLVPTRKPARRSLGSTRIAALGGFVLAATLGLFYILSFTSLKLSADTDAAQVGGAEIRGRSIAVLPFSDLSSDGGQTWFAEGLSEEIMNSLIPARGLTVAQGTAAHRIREGRDVREVGDELGVATILDGTVRRQGKLVRVSLRLIDSQSGYLIWSANYDGRLEDIFGIQDEIAGKATGELMALFALEEGGSGPGQVGTEAEAVEAEESEDAAVAPDD